MLVPSKGFAMPSLLNQDKISTQLRDWRQIAQQKALAYAGYMESRGYAIEASRYSMLLEYINQQTEEIRIMQTNSDLMCKILETEQQAHLLTKGTLMVRTEQLAAERRIYKAARPGTAMPRPEQRCDPSSEFWFGDAGTEFDKWGRAWAETNAKFNGAASSRPLD